MTQPDSQIVNAQSRIAVGLTVTLLLVVGGGSISEARPHAAWYDSGTSAGWLIYGPGPSVETRTGDLYCDPRGLRVSFATHGLREGSAQVTVRSGRQSRVFRGDINTDDVLEYTGAEALVPYASALAREIMATGAVQISARGQSASFPAAPRPLLAHFAANCRSLLAPASG